MRLQGLLHFKKPLIIAIPVLIVFLFSCSGFEKILKSDDYEYKYKMALEYYKKKDHYRYVTLLEQLQNVYRGTFRADTIEFYLAMGYFNQGDYLLAGHQFDMFRKNYKRSAFTEDAEFMYAYCYYKSSPRPELDQTNTYAAIEAFTEYINRYPNTKRKTEVNKIMNELKDKLVEKSYLSSMLYYKIGDYKAAIVAIRNSINDYPQSKYREELMFHLLKASYLLADNSVESKRRERFQNTLDEYYSFISEFPESKYIDEAKKMYEASMKVLQNVN
jgi:outer membrane protein assembly factor BamD